MKNNPMPDEVVTKLAIKCFRKDNTLILSLKFCCLPDRRPQHRLGIVDGNRRRNDMYICLRKGNNDAIFFKRLIYAHNHIAFYG